MTNVKEVELEPRVQELLLKFRKRGCVAEVLRLLKAQLPPQLVYHSASHTDDVMHEAVLFSLYDGLSEREIELLAIAAAFHDVGFVNNALDHEAVSTKIAKSSLRLDGGFSDEEIDLIGQMILDSKLVRTDVGVSQVATTELSKYLLDADLSNLGRSDFFQKLELVRQELGADKHGFAKASLGLITRHNWHTRAAMDLRLEQEALNIKALRDKIFE